MECTEILNILWNKTNEFKIFLSSGSHDNLLYELTKLLEFTHNGEFY